MNDNVFMYQNYETFNKVYKNSEQKNKNQDKKQGETSKFNKLNKKEFQEDHQELRKQDKISKSNIKEQTKANLEPNQLPEKGTNFMNNMMGN